MGTDLIVGQPTKQAFERYDKSIVEFVKGQSTQAKHNLATKGVVDAIRNQFNAVETFMGTRGVTTDSERKLDEDIRVQLKGDPGSPGTPGHAGQDGVPGEDGIGAEYIFSIGDVETVPVDQLPHNDWPYDDPGTAGTRTWYDAAPSVTVTNPILHSSYRLFSGDPETNPPGSDWSEPSVVGRFIVGTPGQQGDQGDQGQQGDQGDQGDLGFRGRRGFAGDDGEDAAGIEYIFARLATNVLPANQRPDNTWTFDNPGTVNGLVWTDAAPGLNIFNQYLFSSQRTISGTDTVTGEWTIPIIVGHFGENGSDGTNGTDGVDRLSLDTAIILVVTNTLITAIRESNNESITIADWFFTFIPKTADRVLVGQDQEDNWTIISSFQVDPPTVTAIEFGFVVSSPVNPAVESWQYRWREDPSSDWTGEPVLLVGVDGTKTSLTPGLYLIQVRLNLIGPSGFGDNWSQATYSTVISTGPPTPGAPTVSDPTGSLNVRILEPPDISSQYPDWLAWGNRSRRVNEEWVARCCQTGSMDDFFIPIAGAREFQTRYETFGGDSSDWGAGATHTIPTPLFQIWEGRASGTGSDPDGVRYWVYYDPIGTNTERITATFWRGRWLGIGGQVQFGSWRPASLAQTSWIFFPSFGTPEPAIQLSVVLDGFTYLSPLTVVPTSSNAQTFSNTGLDI